MTDDELAERLQEVYEAFLTQREECEAVATSLRNRVEALQRQLRHIRIKQAQKERTCEG